MYFIDNKSLHLQNTVYIGVNDQHYKTLLIFALMKLY